MFSKKFVAATKEYTTYTNHIPAPYMRKNFVVNKTLKSAKITICGLGFYELFINGKRITKGLLAPYISNPDDILYYDCYDIADLLQNGKNTIGIMLGNGVLNCFGGAVWQFEKAVFRSAPKVAFALELEDETGTEVIEADETVKTADSPILFNDLRSGEIYDARNEISDWNLPDFDDSKWNNAISAETPRGETRLCNAEPIKTLYTLSPISIHKGKSVYNKEFIHPYVEEDDKKLPIPEDEKGTGYIYDFGSNNAGNTVLKINGKAGQKITIQYGELLTKDGDFSVQNMYFQPRALNHIVRYICKGGEEEIYTPYFTYQGFRYCFVIGITEEQATESLLTYNVMASNVKENGNFSCSDEMFNKLQKAVIRSDLSNFYYFPTDCPHREKNGWTADAALSAEQMLYNFTVENSFEEWMRNICKSQADSGALPGIVPTGGWGFSWGNGPAWDVVLFMLPYYTWLYRGNTKIIEESADSMVRYLNYISKKRDKYGLLHLGLNADWCDIQMSIHRNGPPKIPRVVSDTLVTMNICKLASKMFEVIGLNIQKVFADTLYSELRSAARKYFIEADGITVLGRCQTSQAMGISYNLFDPAEKKAAFDVLLEYIHNRDDHFDAGVIGTKLIFNLLSDYGYSDLAYKMITRTDFPAYGFWIEKEDATTLFESFSLPEQEPWSKNHHFFGHISAWFFKYVLGIKINPYERNANEIEISPNIISTLDNAEGYVNISAGKVSVSWQKEKDEKVIIDITVPDGCEGIIKPPMGYIYSVPCAAGYLPLKSGKYTFVKDCYYKI